MKHLFLIASLCCYTSLFAQSNDTLSNQKINEVVITTTQQQKGFSSKMPLTYIENPQSYDIIKYQTAKDQVATNIKDVLQNATGLVRVWESTGVGVTGGEYYTMRGFAFQPNLLNGMPSFTNNTLDIANIEQVEVVKGPNGTLYGGNVVSYGGLINVITKKPYEQLGGEVNYIGGSNNLNRVALDINTPINKKLFIRLNTAYHKQHAFQDAGYKESFFVAPSVQYNINEKLKLYVDFQYKANEGANTPMFFISRYMPVSFESLDLFEANYKKAYTSNELTLKNPTFTAQAKLEYKINNNWTSNTIINKNNAQSKGYDLLFEDIGTTDEFARYVSKIDSKTNIFSIQQNITGKYNIGSLDNTILFGLDYLSKEFSSIDGDYIEHGIISLINQSDTGDLSKTAIDNALSTSNYIHNKAKTQTFSSYVSNVTNILPNFSFMASLRFDYLEGSTSTVNDQKTSQTTLSPKFGLVYQPIQNKLALFANYLNGFVFLDPAIISDPDGTNKTIQPFDPEQANQFEIGAKTNLLGDKLSATISYYHIKVTNKLMTDLNSLNSFTQGGKVKSEGIELSLTGTPLPGWDIITGFSHNYNVVTKSLPADGNLGFRPEEAGPANLFHLWTNYKLQSGIFKNLSFGIGVNSVSEQKTINRSTLGVFTLPGYTIYNTAIGYDWKKFNAILKIDNLTNKKHFTGNSTVNPQGLRTVSLSLNYKIF
ncbi:TonB-dependent siderophore receptor [Myroides profundi]|uniref:Iron complex outermembrane recepter protein n=1 Tax=Myroides profundi TaxID=480520 RepID=A0AAJ4W4Q7_MYRPR|nr:TonB-dependent receptor [Myroides profundi]AJH15486.1 iron complex outermembrane recepter protein [Myroides profundi]SER09249.1 iron complex outermembrane recepter protein [Myroides profundi]